MQPVTHPTRLSFEYDLLDERLRSITEDKPLARFGLEPLNDLFGGVYPGQMYAIGATPGTGKTTLLLQEAESIAASGTPVIFISAELPAHKLLSKSLARASHGRLAVGDIPGAASPFSEMHDDFLAALESYRSTISPNICITGTTNMADIGCMIANCVRERGQVPVLFVDYLQLIATGGADPFSDERLAIAACVKGLRDLANCYGVPVVAISTITRNSYSAKSPNLSVFGGAAVIEYSFDAAIYLSEDKEAPPVAANSMDDRPVALTVLKNRYGCLDTAHLLFDGAHANFQARR